MNFSDHLSIYSLPAFLTLIVNLFLGLYVFFKKPTNPPNFIFFGMILSISSWNFADFMMMNALAHHDAIFGAKFIKGCLFLPLFFYMFSHHFLTKSRGQSYYTHWHIVCILPGFFALAYMNHVYNTILNVKYLNSYQIYYYHFVFTAKNVVPYCVMIGYGLLYSIAGIINLLRAHKSFKRERERLQIRYFLYGALVFGIASFFMDFSLFSSRTWGLHLSLFFRLSISIFFAVSIMKLKLLGTQILISRTFYYSAFYGIILGSYVWIVKNLGDYFVKLIHIESTYVEAFVIFLLVFLLQPMKGRINNFISKYVYQSAYRLNQEAAEFSRTLGDYVDIDNLLENTYQKLEVLFDISGIAVFLYNKMYQEYSIRYLAGEFYEINISRDSKIVNFLKEYSEPLEVEYLETTYPAICKRLKLMRAGLIIPLVKKDFLVGFIILPEKNSSKKYSIEEIEILASLANQLTMAISHISLVEEMEARTKKFMQTEKMAALYELSAGISHEIRNPLNIIQGSIDIIDDPEQDEETKHEMLQYIKDEITRLNDLITSFLKFSKLKDMKLKLEAVVPFLEQVIQGLQLQAAGKNITIDFSSEEGEHLFYFDRQFLSQVFMNLALNAFDAMDSGGIYEIRVKSCFENGRKFIVISCRDNGCGMDSETREKIFNPFFTTKESGTGLGLSISMRIVKEHEGDITVISEPDKGTEFILTFPAQ